MSEPAKPTPRRMLLSAMQTCLASIRKTDGFNTDAGTWVSTELGAITDENLAPGVQGQMALYVSQQDAPDGAISVRTHRATTVTLLLKTSSVLGASEATLDLLVDDVERAMENKQTQFPPGIPFPTYAGLRPITQVPGSNFVGALMRWTTTIPIR